MLYMRRSVCESQRVTAGGLVSKNKIHTRSVSQFHTVSFSLCLSMSLTLIGCCQGVQAWDRQKEKGRKRERERHTHTHTMCLCVPGPLSSVCSDALNIVLKFNDDTSHATGWTDNLHPFMYANNTLCTWPSLSWGAPAAAPWIYLYFHYDRPQ